MAMLIRITMIEITTISSTKVKPRLDVAHALLRAAPALAPAPGFPSARRCREESRHGTQECVRHVHRPNLARLFPDNALTTPNMPFHRVPSGRSCCTHRTRFARPNCSPWDRPDRCEIGRAHV